MVQQNTGIRPNFNVLLLFVTIFFYPIHSISAAHVNEEFFILDPNSEWIEELAQQADFTIDHVNQGRGFELYGPTGTEEWLQRNAVPYIIAKIDKSALEDYPSPEEIENALKDLHEKYPHLTKLIKIGESRYGRGLWILKISDNPELDETEPEVKYIASMHGNEITGREMLIRFIPYLLENYSVDSEIQQLIDNTEIYIMPAMNPDGNKSGRRGNGYGIDLNRDFPDFTTRDRENTPLNRQKETQAIMNFQKDRQFALSANLHGGAVVVNYPWDTQGQLHPFDQLVKDLSISYSQHVDEMYNSSRFEKGIVNGYRWYEINGGMQDWSYFWHNDLQVTIEVSDPKWPPYSQMDTYYQNHRKSLLTYLKKVHQGMGFKIEGPKNLKGIVSILKVLKGGETEDLGKYSFFNSEFYKVLAPGHYQFKVTFDKSINPYRNFEFDGDVIQDYIHTDGNYTVQEL